jgi:small subunit ribosomal protein S20
MANTRSAEKQQRQAEKAALRNRAGKTRLRTALKKVRASVTDAKSLSTGFSEIDKAAKRGVIKGNTADRYKSRLAAAAKRESK